jgi:hypothetical protein
MAGAIEDAFEEWDPPFLVQLNVVGWANPGKPGYLPGFTPTEARKLADALYKAAQECEQEIAKREAAKREEAERAERMKTPLIRDPDGFVGGAPNAPLWFVARGGEVLGYFSPEESARNYVRVSGAQLCKLDIGPITAARHRAFADLLEQAKAAGV